MGHLKAGRTTEAVSAIGSGGQGSQKGCSDKGYQGGKVRVGDDASPGENGGRAKGSGGARPWPLFCLLVGRYNRGKSASWSQQWLFSLWFILHFGELP